MEEFVKYTGGYVKQFYDVLQDGIVYPQIWPNGGAWRTGGLTLCSYEEEKEIHIRKSFLHPYNLSMENSLKFKEYESIIKDKEAYIKYRRPIAKAEHDEYEREYEAEQEKLRDEFRVRFISRSDGDKWECKPKNARPYEYFKPRSKDDKRKIKMKRKAQRRARLRGRK